MLIAVVMIQLLFLILRFWGLEIVGNAGNIPLPRLEGETGKYLKQCDEKPINEWGYRGMECHDDMKKDGIVYECADLACYKLVDPSEFYDRWVPYCYRMMIGGGAEAAPLILIFVTRWIVRKIYGLKDDSCPQHWDP